MKIAVFAICTIVISQLTVTSTKSLDGIRDLVKRRIPKHVSSFSFEFMDGPGDSFVVSDSRSRLGVIDVKCTLTSACARGLYEYLKERGGVGMWWTGSRLDQLPSRPPPVGDIPIQGSSTVKYRYYFNTVTFSYTTVFWPFDQTQDSGSDNWSYLLDWQALHGINLPLAWNGHEYILGEVYRDAGLSDSEIRSYFSEPAFLSWNRLGNIQGSWGSSEKLPEQWIGDQFALQKKIVQRMVSLGMTPALSSFTGFVPNALHKHYPMADIIVTESRWDEFPAALTNVSFLNPVDQLFKTLQTSYLKKQQEAYGADVSHVYALDQYNENRPLADTLRYLHDVSSHTISSLQAADPEGIWLMQAWMFFRDASFWTRDRIDAYLGGIPNHAVLILDLYAEAQPEWQNTGSYGGKPWVWCQLHGFSGNIGIEGNLVNLTTQPLKALEAPGSSMQGVGLTMEGHDQGNEIVYSLLLDQAWSTSPIDLTTYISTFTSQRYLTKSLPSAALQAWRSLASTVYNNSDPNSQATVKSVFILQPALSGLANLTGHHPTKIFYNTNETIVPALKLLLQASRESKALRGIPEFAYDVVNLMRQVLGNYFIQLYIHLVAIYNSPQSKAEDVATAGKPLLEILSAIDEVLMTNEHFLLSKWIRSARDLAGTDCQYADLLEFNARNQITLWGPQGQNNDRAGKDWGGLVHSYYLVRWQAFVGYLEGSKRSATPYNATVVNQKMFKIADDWRNEIWGKRPGEMWGTRGDTWQVVDKILRRWV